MAVGQYTSHMSGIVSSMADNLVLGDLKLLLMGLLALCFFLAGAGFSAILINWGRRRDLKSVYALPLAVEAWLMGVFALSGAISFSEKSEAIAFIVMLLCFIMGLQNAIITKLSGARIRTTHVTGLVTDTGIELGKLFYWNGYSNGNVTYPPVRADLAKLWLLVRMVGLFFGGGVVGAILFQRIGVSAAGFLAIPLALAALYPMLEDYSSQKQR
ncbi:YoaK family protein [Allorhizobium sp. Av2]